MDKPDLSLSCPPYSQGTGRVALSSAGALEELRTDWWQAGTSFSCNARSFGAVLIKGNPKIEDPFHTAGGLCKEEEYPGKNVKFAKG